MYKNWIKPIAVAHLVGLGLGLSAMEKGTDQAPPPPSHSSASASASSLSEEQTGYKVIPTKYGHGLFARRGFHASEVISAFSFAETSATPSRWTVQFGPEQHGEPRPIELRYVNHSCSPNVKFDLDSRVLRAIRDIEPGEEFAFFYPSTEWSMEESFSCECGSVDCIGLIGGASQMSAETTARYWFTPVIEALRQSVPGHVTQGIAAGGASGSGDKHSIKVVQSGNKKCCR